jgi:hypothetical protein
MVLKAMRQSLFLATLVSSAALVGCGSGFPATAPVSGTVTYKGKPVEGANVTFGRDQRDSMKGEVASAKTDANGVFRLSTHFGSKATAEGAVPGTYQVTVSKFVPPGDMTMAAYQAMVDAAEKIGQNGDIVPPNLRPPSLIEMFPSEYSASGKSSLTATVPPGGNTRLNFDLK